MRLGLLRGLREYVAHEWGRVHVVGTTSRSSDNSLSDARYGWCTSETRTRRHGEQRMLRQSRMGHKDTGMIIER